MRSTASCPRVAPTVAAYRMHSSSLGSQARSRVHFTKENGRPVRGLMAKTPGPSQPMTAVAGKSISATRGAAVSPRSRSTPAARSPEEKIRVPS